MSLGAQFWAAIATQALLGLVLLAMMKQQLRDLVGWVKRVQGDVENLREGQKDHEGRISHVEGRLGIPRGGE